MGYGDAMHVVSPGEFASYVHMSSVLNSPFLFLVRDRRKISELSDLADVCKVSIRFVRMCRLERCRKATGSDTS